MEISGDERLLLASGSPRRRVMLEAAGVALVARPVEVDERPWGGEAPLDFARRMAVEKAEAGVAARRPGEPRWALGGDTVVVLDGELLGKPADAEQAARMLRALSGRVHQVVSAWALRGPGGGLGGVSCAEVRFGLLSDEAIAAYVATGEPLDKAGAYGVQGDGGRLVEAVVGDFDTVVGLPLGEVLGALGEVGVAGPAPGLPARLAVLRGRIAAAAQAAHRRRDSVTLVGVSKRQPVALLREALAAGLRDLGENYVQEWQRKAELLGDAPRWHFIGHLQRNKARSVANRVAMVHGVDGVPLARALGRRAVDRPVPILAQINLAGEASKAGLPRAGVAEALAAMAEVEGVDLQGLMVIPPAGGLGAARRQFAALRRLRDEVASEALPLSVLSMGMSADFPAAVAEGATHVRVGSALFGARL